MREIPLSTCDEQSLGIDLFHSSNYTQNRINILRVTASSDGTQTRRNTSASVWHKRMSSHWTTLDKRLVALADEEFRALEMAYKGQL